MGPELDALSDSDGPDAEAGETAGTQVWMIVQLAGSVPLRVRFTGLRDPIVAG